MSCIDSEDLPSPSWPPRSRRGQFTMRFQDDHKIGLMLWFCTIIVCSNMMHVMFDVYIPL